LEANIVSNSVKERTRHPQQETPRTPVSSLKSDCYEHSPQIFTITGKKETCQKCWWEWTMQHQGTQSCSEELLPASLAPYQIWIQNLGSITVILTIWPEL